MRSGVKISMRYNSRDDASKKRHCDDVEMRLSCSTTCTLQIYIVCASALVETSTAISETLTFILMRLVVDPLIDINRGTL